MRRREFITSLGALTAWPLTARAQQAERIRHIGVLMAFSANDPEAQSWARGFREELGKLGWTEGHNIQIDTRWATADVESLQRNAKQLVALQPDLILTGSTPATAAMRQQTNTIPIVFAMVGDPVGSGFVASLSRPGGNLTGINFFASELAAKRMELLREMVPTAARVAVLGDPTFTLTESQVRDAETAARAMGLQIQILNASNSREINAAFANFVRERPDALYVGTGPFFASRRVQLALLAGHYGVPAIYGVRLFTEAGGLMSYGTSLTDAYRQMGVYTGHILKGAKPADLPVIQSTKFELIINAETARMLGLTVPPTLLAHADEVIE